MNIKPDNTDFAAFFANFSANGFDGLTTIQAPEKENEDSATRSTGLAPGAAEAAAQAARRRLAKGKQNPPRPSLSQLSSESLPESVAKSVSVRLDIFEDENGAGPSNSAITPAISQPASPVQRPRIGLSNISFSPELTDIERDELMAPVRPHIANMSGRSPNIKNRIMPSVSFAPRKPASEQYRYAKDNLSGAERTLVSAGLEEIIRQDKGDPDVTKDDALDMWLAVQHARLRTHTATERANHRRKQSLSYVMAGLTAVLYTGVGLIYLPIEVRKLKREHKNYYRAPDRMEYGLAFNGMMEMLASPEVSLPHKRKIAKTLLDQHIRKERTVAPIDMNRIISMLPGGRGTPARGHILIKPPTPTEDETALHDAMIALAQDGYRHDPNAAANTLARQRLAQAMGSERHAQLAEAAKAKHLSENVERIFAEAIVTGMENGSELLPMPALFEQYDKERNADAFSALLERIITPPNQTSSDQLTPPVKAALYQNTMMIVDAVAKSPELRQRVFDQSVGGLGHCNNNVLEVFSRLSATVRHHEMVQGIAEGKTTPEAFAQAGIKNFRQETLENYISEILLKTDGRKSEFLGLHPEVSLSLKSALKTTLGLPDSVTELNVPFWKPKPGDIEKTRDYVKAAEANSKIFTNFFDTDPLWREGIVALTERYNPADKVKLHAFTRMDDFIEMDEHKIMHLETSETIEDPGVMKARGAWDNLNNIYRPSDDHGTHKELCSHIDRMHHQFADSRRAIERQLTRHVNPHLFVNLDGADARLPTDGQFSPTFALPENWRVEIGDLQILGARAEAEHIANKIEEKHAEIVNLDREISAGKLAITDMTQAEIEAGLDGMAQRRKDRAAGKTVADNTVEPHEGLVALNTLSMQRAKLADEVSKLVVSKEKLL